MQIFFRRTDNQKPRLGNKNYESYLLFVCNQVRFNDYRKYILFEEIDENE
ncbi:MAG: hypothetical protein J6S67_19930 [Methanobrevibacter sp.]|nr:hypothetical protein [Methanobrevibacter sp.]